MRKNKYGAIKTTLDGMKFDSLGEAKHYSDLKIRLLAKEITDLKTQVKFPLNSGGKHICDYIADFTYYENGTLVVDDYKGVSTAVFRIKAKLFEAIYGFPIRISGKKTKVIKCKPAHAIGYKPIGNLVKPTKRKGKTHD